MSVSENVFGVISIRLFCGSGKRAIKHHTVAGVDVKNALVAVEVLLGVGKYAGLSALLYQIRLAVNVTLVISERIGRILFVSEDVDCRNVTG